LELDRDWLDELANRTFPNLIAKRFYLEVDELATTFEVEGA
jgi:hypothetical protein